MTIDEIHAKPKFNIESPVLFASAESVNGEEAPLQNTAQINAYNGGLMNVGLSKPVVVNLENMKAIKKGIPIFKDHDPKNVLGHLVTSKKDKQIDLDMTFSGANEATREVIDSGKKGFPWQASIGASVGKLQYIEPKETKVVNGKKVSAENGFFIAHNTKLFEVSIVALGADDTTKSIVASQWDEQHNSKKPEQEETFMADNKQDTPDIQAEVEKKEEVVIEAKKEELPSREELKAEVEAEIKAEADAKELAELRAAKAEHVEVQVGESNEIEKLTATSLIKCGLSTDEFEADVVKAANRDRHLTVKDIIKATCEMEGVELKGKSETEMIKAGFSTTNLSGILGAVANKSLLAGYASIDPTVEKICKTASVSNFQTHTRYRMDGAGDLAEVGQNGEVQHGELSENSFTNQAKTYGKRVMLSRHDIVNDNLSAFAEIPSMLGRSAALKKEAICYGLINANAGSFFSSGNGNLEEGTTTALSIDALANAEVALEAMEDALGNPIALQPSILLVPTALKRTAMALMASETVNETTTANKAKPVANTFRGAFEVVSSPYLSNSGLTGYSATAWYLMAAPADVAAIEIAYLNGQSQPIFETGEPDFGVLGMGYMLYYDFGIALQDGKAIIKSTGVS